VGVRTTALGFGLSFGLGLLTASAVVAVGCGSETKNPGRFPPRPVGCDVLVFHDTPSVPTHNVGSVDAVCGEDIKDQDCLQTLKDQVCKLGGDVVWGVAEQP